MRAINEFCSAGIIRPPKVIKMFDPKDQPETPRPAPHPTDRQIREWDPMGVLSSSIQMQVREASDVE